MDLFALFNICPVILDVVKKAFQRMLGSINKVITWLVIYSEVFPNTNNEYSDTDRL